MNMTVPLQSNPVPKTAVRFGGLRFTPLMTDEAVAALAARPAELPFAVFVTPNAEHAWLRTHDEVFRQCGDTCWLSTNDSRVLRRTALLGGLDLGFAPGAHVVDMLFDRVIQPDDPIAVIGSHTTTVETLTRQFSLRNIAHHNPPMGFIHDDAAVAAAVDFIAAHPARFVFVAMGPPQSEKLCQRVIEDGRASGVGLCIGSSINMITSQAPRAPDWMERAGMVWLSRLAREPRRLWRRYLVRGVYGLGRGLVDVVALRLKLKSAVIRDV